MRSLRALCGRSEPCFLLGRVALSSQESEKHREVNFNALQRPTQCRSELIIEQQELIEA